jgi:hypothetical protein
MLGKRERSNKELIKMGRFRFLTIIIAMHPKNPLSLSSVKTS